MTIEKVNTEQAWTIITAEPGKIISLQYLDHYLEINTSDWYRTFVKYDYYWDIEIVAYHVFIKPHKA